MRPLKLSIVGPIAAATASAIGVLDYQQRPFDVSFSATLRNSSATVSYKVQVTADNPNDQTTFVSLSRTGTTVTVIQPNHGLRSNDSVIVAASGIAGADGYQPFITVVDNNTYTYPTVASGNASDQNVTRVATVRWFDSTAIPAATATALQGNQTNPVLACRLVAATLTGTGSGIDLVVVQGLGRG